MKALRSTWGHFKVNINIYFNNIVTKFLFLTKNTIK